jgi:hypothetical protein
LRGHAPGACSATPPGWAAGGRDAPVELGRAGVAFAAEAGFVAAVGLEAMAEREGGRRRTMGPEVLQTGDGLLHRGDRPLGDPPEAQDRLGRGLEERYVKSAKASIDSHTVRLMISSSSSKALMLVASPLSSCRRQTYPGLASASVLIRARFMRKSSMIGSSIGARKRATFSCARCISPLYRPMTPGRRRKDEPERLSRPCPANGGKWTVVPTARRAQRTNHRARSRRQGRVSAGLGVNVRG